MKSQNIIWKRVGKHDVKGKLITLTGSRSTDDTRTITDANAKVDKDAQKVIDDGKTLGQINTDFNVNGEPFVAKPTTAIPYPF